MKKLKFKGFTLIELLVVIAIIGVLSTLAVVSLNSARQKARDAKRVADIKQIQTALELYYNDNNGYPTGTLTLGVDGRILCGGTLNTGFIAATTNCGAGSTTYMGAVPSNPTPSPTGGDYVYSSAAAGTYSISFALETSVGNLTSGAKIATPDGVSD